MWLLRVAGALAVAMALSSQLALAQNTTAEAAIATSSLAATRCGAFAHLAAADRDRMVRRMVADAPARSLTSTENPRYNSNGELVISQGQQIPGTPLSAGQLVSACQAASPNSSLRDAFMQARDTGLLSGG